MVFAEYWIIVVNIMAEFMCLFMPGAVEWLNDAMAEIESMMLIMQIVVLMVRGMDVVMMRINVVVLLIVIIMMITMHFEMMGIVPLIVMAIFVPVSV